MKKHTIIHQGNTYKFRKLTEKDTDWLNKEFAEEGKPVGFVNFKEKISNFNDYPVLAQTLTIIMHYLLVFPKDISLDEFEKKFGIKYQDIAVLYYQFNTCMGNTEKDVKKNQKLVKQNWYLKQENRELKYRLFLEKAKKTKQKIIGFFQ